MRKTVRKKLMAFGLTAALVISAVTTPNHTDAAKKAVKKITVNKKKVTLYKGAVAGYGSVQITAKVSPEKAAKTKLKWKSSKKKVATVNAKGMIKAKNPGKATITVSGGGKSAKIKVTVKSIKNKVTRVAVANGNMTIIRGETSDIKTTVTPKKATLKSVVYSSANKQIATVSSKGVVKGVKAGTTTITVKAADGSKKQAKITVQVVEPEESTSTAPVNSPNPSAAPSGEPSVAPGEEPSTAPGEEPSAAPSDEPSTAPSDEPSAAPSDEPSAAPSEEPFSKQITGSQDEQYPDNTKFVLDAENTYLLKTTIDGEEYEAKVNEATVNLAEKAIAGLAEGAKNLSVAYDSFVKKSETASYQVAEDITVTVVKESGSNQASIKVNCAYENISGEYTFCVEKSNQEYAVSVVKEDQSNRVSAVIVQPDSNVAEYQLSQMVVIRDNKPVKENELDGKIINVIVKESGNIVTVNATSGEYSATATYNKETRAVDLVATNGADTFTASYDGIGEYTVSVPKRFLEDYNFKLFQ